MRLDTSEIELNPFALEDARVVDVRIDGHRVWSVTVPYAEDGRIVLAWPTALKEYLNGRARVSIADSATGRLIQEREVQFGSSRSRNRRVEVTDARGRWLAMTKWDRLGPVLEGRDDDTNTRLIRAAERLVSVLETNKYEPYLVGGSLLGIVRNGGMLPHDDDIDLAFLCEADNPLDIGLESYKMERLLEQNGYTVVRHSLAHLELEFFTADGEPDYYIDIFTGFFHEGLYNQPFALRGEGVERQDLVPTRRLDLDGTQLPAPASPESWLAYAYGPGWRVPDPTFKFVSPKSTLARFETWFGVFNRGRVYWDKRYLSGAGSPVGQGASAVERFLKDVPAGARILDLGCGDGRWTGLLASRGHRVTGIDYSHEALRLARSRQVGPGGVDHRYLNLNDRAALFEFGRWMLETGDEWCVFALHSLQSMTKVNRQNVLLFLDLVLRGRGFADIVSDEELSSSYRRGDPSTWHLPVSWLEDEMTGHPLELTTLSRGSRRDEGRGKRPVTHSRVRRREGVVTGGDARDQTLRRELRKTDKRSK